MGIVWLSANEFGLELLKEAIAFKLPIKAIITLNENATTKMYDGVPVREWYQFGIPVFQVNNINDEYTNSSDYSRDDYLFVCGWRQLLKPEILSMFKCVIGTHISLLPCGRGSAPIINSILHGFKKSGVSMFVMSGGVDDGPIIAQEAFDINDTDDSIDVYAKAVSAGKKLVKKQLMQFINGKIFPVFQDISEVTVFDKPKLSDNRIDLEKDSLDFIIRKIRALAKYRGAYIEKDGKRLVIRKAELVG